MTTAHKVVRILMRGCALLFLFSVVAIPISAQTNKGTIKGTVTDQNGAVVQNAEITVTNVETNAVRTVNGGADGTYEVPLLDPGKYKVTVKAPSFPETVRENITVQTASTEVVDVTITAGQVGATVTVTAAPSQVETETSDRGSVVTGREVTELPLSGRNFTQLATLTPGVSRVTIGTLSDARANNNGDPNAGGQGPGGGDARGSTESARFARSGGAVLSANGQRPTNNNFSVDGVDNNEPQFGSIGVFVNPDAIAEFKVTTSVPPAEIGRAGGAVINTSFTSGTNQFHGSGYYYGQNSALNAYHPILKRNRAEAIARHDVFIPVKATQQIHEFGGTIGGPIIKNRTFFFFDYLGGRNNLPTPLSSTVPTADVRNGIFGTTYTSTRDCGRGISGVICDATTGLPFANATIPAGRISTNTQKFFNLFPSPTAFRLNPGQFDNNFFSQRNVKEKIDNYDIKIDHRVANNNSLSGRYSHQNFTAIRGSFFPDVPAGFGAGNEFGNSRQLVLTDTHTFSPTVLNEFRFGYTKIDIGIFNCGVGGACGISGTFSQDIGIPNVNNGTLEQSGSILTGGFGNGFVEFAGDGGPFIVNSKNPYFADTLTVLKGKHSIKFGGELRLRHLHTIDGGRTGGLKGNLAYADNGPATGTNLACPAASQSPSFDAATGAGCFVDAAGIAFGGTGLAIANMLDNRVASLQTFRGSVPGGAFDLRSSEYGFFIQDDFKASDRLTLNLGLRYDIFPAATEKSGRLGNYDPATRTVIVASDSGDSLIKTDKNNFGPRIGFAYAIGPEKKMVIRGGYGLLYTLDAVDRPPLVQNPPFTNSITFNNAFDSSTPRSVFNLQTGPPTVPVISPTLLISPGGAITVFRQDPNQKTALVHQFNISYQVQFGKDYALDVGYVGNRARNLLQSLDIGGSGTAEARNTAGAFLSGKFYTNRARSNYDALQAQLQKRLSNNIQGQVSYTYSRNRDDSTGVFQGIGEGRGTQGGPQNPFDPEAEYGVSSLDVPHLLSADAIIDLPFGKGQRYLNSSGVADKLVGGLQLNIIVSGRSGYPSAVVDGDNQSRRANLIGDPFSNVPAGRFLNVAAFGGPTGPCPGPNCVVNAAGQQIKFGTLPRNSFRGPGFVRTDFSIFKNTGLTERLKMQLGFEFFNVFNQATYTVPNNNFRDAGSFGRFDAALPGRVIQYRVKLLF